MINNIVTIHDCPIKNMGFYLQNIAVLRSLSPSIFLNWDISIIITTIAIFRTHSTQAYSQ